MFHKLIQPQWSLYLCDTANEAAACSRKFQTEDKVWSATRTPLLVLDNVFQTAFDSRDGLSALNSLNKAHLQTNHDMDHLQLVLLESKSRLYTERTFFSLRASARCDPLKSVEDGCDATLSHWLVARRTCGESDWAAGMAPSEDNKPQGQREHVELYLGYIWIASCPPCASLLRRTQLKIQLCLMLHLCWFLFFKNLLVIYLSHLNN